ncbi:hypothetical protein DE146DRAFT_67743 [Phaeosphaeria sp. MPI-PUGE-AT-0046c]|nr:hypothetical protein DE146DRAFT_67743 [Phaeosphaeria sp. MPI-PUGE-AT-0046c]
MACSWEGSAQPALHTLSTQAAAERGTWCAWRPAFAACETRAPGCFQVAPDARGRMQLRHARSLDLLHCPPWRHRYNNVGRSLHGVPLRQSLICPHPWEPACDLYSPVQQQSALVLDCSLRHHHALSSIVRARPLLRLHTASLHTIRRSSTAPHSHCPAPSRHRLIFCLLPRNQCPTVSALSRRPMNATRASSSFHGRGGAVPDAACKRSVIACLHRD